MLLRRAALPLLSILLACSTAGPTEPGPGGEESTAVETPEATTEDRPYLGVLFAGDTHFNWAIATIQSERGALAPVEAIRPLFQAADIRVLNLETSLSDRGRPFTRKHYIFNASPDNARVLTHLGVDVAILGNNHSMDMGAEGLVRTVESLRRVGIASVGAGSSDSESYGPLLLSLGDRRVALLSYSAIGTPEMFSAANRPGVAQATNAIVYQVGQATRLANHVIVSMHWGSEYFTAPDPAQVALAHRIIDAGAVAVIGHHPHIPHGVERYRNGIICYSLGNFLFGSINQDQDHNLVVRLDFDREQPVLRQVRFFPVFGRYRDGGTEPRLLGPGPAREFWRTFYLQTRSLSEPTARDLRMLPDGSAVLAIVSG